jgi:hypothetical protein
MLTDDSRKPATILEEWRTAERQLADAKEGSAEYDALAARVLELARAYRDASGDLVATAKREPSASVEPPRFALDP